VEICDKDLWHYTTILMEHFVKYLRYLKFPFSPEVFLHYRSAIGFFLIVVILSFVIDFFLSHSFLGSKYRFFLAPGVIIHEMSHGFACIFTGAKVSEMALFEKDGGHVKHTRPRIPVIGPAIISLAPLIAGILIIYLTSKYLNSAEYNPFNKGYGVNSLLEANINFAKNLLHLSIRNWILLYIVISVAVTMTPSRQDFSNAFFPLLFLMLIFLIVSKLTHILLPVSSFNLLLLSVINLLILMLVLSIIVFVISNFFLGAKT